MGGTVSVTPLPRNPALDGRLASDGPSSEALQVYADWIAEREHPLAGWIRDGVLADAGDRAAAQRVRARQHHPLQANLSLQWCVGVVARIEVESTDDYGDASSEALRAVLAQPWAQLLCAARVALGRDAEHDRLVLAELALPPSVGALAIVDPQWPVRADLPGLDLAPVRCPGLRDLQLQAESLATLPDAPFAQLRRLDLCTRDPGPLADVALPALEVLHVATTAGRSVVEALLRTTRGSRLRTFGLHHDGGLDELLGWPVPDGVEELVLEVRTAERSAMEALAGALPTSVRSVRIPWVDLGEGPLPRGFTPEPTDDVPVFV